MVAFTATSVPATNGSVHSSHATPRLLWESARRFHSTLPSWADFEDGQSTGASLESLEAQLEAQGVLLEVETIEALLRARGFVPVTREPTLQQAWVRRVCTRLE